MYFDLFLPFPVAEQDQPKKKNKGKNRQPGQTGSADQGVKKTCWDGLRGEEKDAVARDIALAGHRELKMSRSVLMTVGYSVAGLTVQAEPTISITPCPFSSGLPYPHLDPRQTPSMSAGGSGGGSSSTSKPAQSSHQSKLGTPVMVQVSRYHIRLDDNKSHPLVSSPTESSDT